MKIEIDVKDLVAMAHGQAIGAPLSKASIAEFNEKLNGGIEGLKAARIAAESIGGKAYAEKLFGKEGASEAESLLVAKLSDLKDGLDLAQGRTLISINFNN